MRNQGDDEAFGLIEVVVALFLLALISVAFLPVLANTVKQSADNATRSTGIELAQSTIDSARKFTTCAGVTALGGSATSLDARGVHLTSAVTVGTCPTGISTTAPGTISISVTVTRADTHVVIASANTLVLVTG